MSRKSRKRRKSRKLGIWLSLLLTVSIGVLAAFRLADVGKSNPSYESSGTSQTVDPSTASSSSSSSGGESESADPSSSSASSAVLSETSTDLPEGSGGGSSSEAKDERQSYPYPQYPYGYDRLDDAQRELYDLLESGSITPEQPYYFDPPVSGEEQIIEMELVISLYEENHPTGVWRENGYFQFYSSTGELAGIRSDRQSDNEGRDQEMEAAFDQAEKEILARLPSPDAPDLEKAKAIVRLIAETTEYYDIAFHPPARPLTAEESNCFRDASNEYGALVNGKAICTGYTAAFQYLAEKLNLHCLSISGEAGGVSHAWNLLWLDGKWYHVDVTWMDRDEEGDINWAYFLCSDEEMLASRHTEWVWSSSYGLNSYPLFALPAADTPWPDRESLWQEE